MSCKIIGKESYYEAECHIYVTMKTMCLPGYNHNGYTATRALGHVTCPSA